MTLIPLRALADQSQPLQRDTRQIAGFRRYVEPANSRRMGDDHLDHADVDPESDRTVRRSNRSTGPIYKTRLTLLRTHLAVVDQLLPVEVADLLLPEITLERRERCCLAPTWRFLYLAHIGYTKVDEVYRCLEAGDGRFVRRQPLIDPGLHLVGLSVRRRRDGGTSRSRELPFRLIWTR